MVGARSGVYIHDMNIPSSDAAQAADSYQRIAAAIGYLREHRQQQPELAELAAQIGLSESHVQRLFSRWAGISPKRFLQFLTVEHAKRGMAQTGGLLDLALSSGLSGPGRLHDLFVNMEAMTPGEFKRLAEGLTIRYGFADTPFGTALLAFSSRGVCHLSFVEPGQHEVATAALFEQWPRADWTLDAAASRDLAERIFLRRSAAADKGLSLWVSGSNFQIQVWRALIKVPFGGLLSYGQLAGLLGRPRAARSVGSAVAHNPVAFLIPCHRILRESGDFGVYHWGTDRKMAVCAWEAAQLEGDSPTP